MIYAIVFILSLLFAFGAEQFQNGKKPFFCFSAFCSVLTLSILNGIRDYSIGTDIGVYGKKIFVDASQSHSFTEYMRQCKRIGMTEYGYAILNYIVGFFTSNPHVFFFVLGLLVNGIFFGCCVRLCNTASLTFTWATYLLIFYPTTLNLLRQSVALSIIFIAILEMLEKRLLESLIWIFIAYSFHHSAIIGLWPLVFVYLFNKIKKESKKNTIIIVFLAISALIPTVILKLNSFGLLDDKYSQYVSLGDGSGSMTNAVLVRLPFIILSLFYLVQDRKKNNDENKILWTLVLTESTLLPLQLISPSLFRIALYLGIFKIPGYTSLIKHCRFSKSLLYSVYAAYLLFYFMYMTVISGSNQIYPFVVANDLF